MELDVYDFKGPGVALSMYNVDKVCITTYCRIGNAMPYLFAHLGNCVD